MYHNISKKDALSAAQKLCSREERCIFDVREKLEKWGLPDSDSDEVIEQLVLGKYINEDRYAQSYANDRFKFGKWGRIKIRHSLRLKELPDEAINNALESIDENEYNDLLKEELHKKLRTIKDAPALEIKAKLFRFAATRGFENDNIYKMMDEVLG